MAPAPSPIGRSRPSRALRTARLSRRLPGHRTRDALDSVFRQPAEGNAMPPLCPAQLLETMEGRRLYSAELARWRQWGPYLSERQWGTVREDYSANGTAWD